jgi:hypothetical protein
MVKMVPIRAVHREAPARNSMIGLVLVTHGRLAVEFRAALEHVVGPQSQIETITIGPDDDVSMIRTQDHVLVRTNGSGLVPMAGRTASYCR